MTIIDNVEEVVLIDAGYTLTTNHQSVPHTGIIECKSLECTIFDSGILRTQMEREGRIMIEYHGGNWIIRLKNSENRDTIPLS